MEFLKKNFEIVALVVALVAVISSATYLSIKVRKLKSVDSISLVRGAPVEPVDLSVYSNAIDTVRSPTLWDPIPGGYDGFRTQPPAEPVEPVVITNTTGPPITLLHVQYLPFKLLFMAYSGEGYNVQINFQFRRTFIVRAVGDQVKDDFEDTGYRLTKFQKKLNDQGRDVSEVTLQHEGEDPIVLVLGHEAVEKEPVALVRCEADQRRGEVRRGKLIKCGETTYKVVDINAKQMIVLDADSEEKHTIELAQPGP